MSLSYFFSSHSSFPLLRGEGVSMLMSGIHFDGQKLVAGIEGAGGKIDRLGISFSWKQSRSPPRLLTSH